MDSEIASQSCSNHMALIQNIKTLTRHSTVFEFPEEYCEYFHIPKNTRIQFFPDDVELMMIGIIDIRKVMKVSPRLVKLSSQAKPEAHVIRLGDNCFLIVADRKNVEIRGVLILKQPK